MCVCVCVRETKREGQRKRERGKERERKKETERCAHHAISNYSDTQDQLYCTYIQPSLGCIKVSADSV